jgi:hypothetical protein
MDPDLVLDGVAAGDALLLSGGQSVAGKAGAGLANLLGGGDLHTEVVEGPALALPFEEDELERGFGDGEVGVAGTTLGRLDTEELGVELHRSIEVGHVESELDTGHGTSTDVVSMSIDV